MTLRAAALGMAASLFVTTAAAAADYGALFDEVWKTVAENFYDPGFHGQDWKAVGARHRPKAAATADDAAFAREVAATLAELKASHLYLNRPVAAGGQGGAGIGAALEEIGGQQVVVDIAPLSDAQAKGLRVGDRILNPAAARGPLGQVSALHVVGCDGKRRTVSVRHERAFWPPPLPAFTWRTIQTRPGVKLGYIRIDRFDDGAAGLADRAMADLKDTQGIVIDVRANSGGNISSLRLVSHFLDGARPTVALLAQPYLKALGHAPTEADIARLKRVRGRYTDEGIFQAIGEGGGAALFETEDVGPRYRGKVAVVISGETGSAGEGFAFAMRELVKAPLVGRRTAGVILSGNRFELSGGWVLTVPVDGIWTWDGRDVGDVPTSPDVAVPRTAAGVCRADDPDLAAALKIVDPG